jgi:hypothetical protein
MIVSINQPSYLPWLGYFQRIAASDVHVVLDHVQFEKNSFTNRNRIRTPQGWVWLSVPVLTSGRSAQKIQEVMIDNRVAWCRKHWRTMLQNYGKAPFFNEYGPFFEDMYAQRWEQLVPLIDRGTEFLLQQLYIETKIIRSSTLDVYGEKSDLVLQICQTLGADTYLSGKLGRDYLDESSFREAGIEIIYQDYKHPVYHQRYEPFESNMSTVDLLFNCGLRSSEIALSCQDPVSR